MSRACFICRRESLSELTFRASRTVCGDCAIHADPGERMMACTDLERDALEKGGERAGAYLEEIGRFDLSDLSAEQWSVFLEQVLEGYSAHMVAAVRQEPPF